MTNEKLNLRIHGLMRRLQLTRSELKEHALFVGGVFLQQETLYASGLFWAEVYKYLDVPESASIC